MLKNSFLILCFFAFSKSAYGQNVQIELGPSEIGENQGWTIAVTVTNDRLKNYEGFPDIDGFQKRGTSSSSQTNIINGQVSSSQSIIMTYTPKRQGIVNVPSFKMKVNDQLVTVAGKKVKVGPPIQAQQVDPFRSFFDNPSQDNFFNKGAPEFIDIKDEAQLAFITNKDEVYVGEGFTATLSFLVAENNQAPMQFYELGKQLPDIVKKLKPASCWEENFNIENIEGEPIEINGRGYTQYKIYQATFFPLNNQPLTFPSVGLKMIKFKVAKTPLFFGQNRQEGFKTFYSRPKTIRIKELPPHPLRDAVAVGNYRLDDRLSATRCVTGQSIGYEFTIVGEGNISGINKPIATGNTSFEIYEPNIKQNVNREAGHVVGKKSFSYFIIPKEPGAFPLNSFFKWVYFNPKTGKYDTLQSQHTLTVTGESQKNQLIENNDLDSFYDRAKTADNRLQTFGLSDLVKISISIFVLLLLAASAYIIFKK